jgi:hypothetical protein
MAYRNYAKGAKVWFRSICYGQIAAKVVEASNEHNDMVTVQVTCKRYSDHAPRQIGKWNIKPRGI